MGATLTYLLVAFAAWRFGVWCGMHQPKQEKCAPEPRSQTIEVRRSELANEAGRAALLPSPMAYDENDDHRSPLPACYAEPRCF